MTFVVHPHLHRRRTGVTTHVEAIVAALAKHADTRVVEAAITGKVLNPSLSHASLGDVRRRSRAEPTVWHAHRNNELMLGLLLRLAGARLRIVFTRHSAPRPSAFTRFLAARADGLVSISEEVATNLGLPSRVVSHGVDLLKFQPPADREAAWKQLGLNGRYGVGVVGRVRHAKGQGDFVDAIGPLLPARGDWRAVLVGAALGKDVEWAAALRRQTGDALVLAGQQEDVAAWYRGLSILVQPSHAEGFSLSFLEGFASGCCVVATRVGVFPTFIEHGRTGFLFDRGDVAGLRELLDMLMREPDRVAAIGRAAAEEARGRHGIEREAAALAALYGELTGAT